MELTRPETTFFAAVRLFATACFAARLLTEFLKDALAAGCCLATTFFGLLLAAGFLAVTFLAVGVPPAPGFLVAVLPVLAFRTESRDDGVFLAATFDGLIFALGAPAVGFFGFVDAAPGRETLMSPPVERPAGRAFGAFTVGRLVGLLR